MGRNRKKPFLVVLIVGVLCIAVGIFAVKWYAAHSGETGFLSAEENAGRPGDNTGLEDSAEPGNTAGPEGAAEPGNTAGQESGQDSSSEISLVNPAGNTVAERILTPPGFERTENPGGFGKFLRAYPVYKDGKKVKLYDGTDKWNQDAHAAVLKMKLVEGDLQQCADSVMRLYGEYFYQAGAYDKISFHLVNGFAVGFDKWQQGWRVSVNGDDTSWTASASPSDSKQTFEQYLRFVFAYASTLSMEKESKRIKKSQIQAGDIFIYGGSPGHVVLVMDVCENEAGEKAFLLGQGYMPAQQFHVLKNPLHENDPWYYVSELQYPLETPEYSFDKGSLRRPQYG